MWFAMFALSNLVSFIIGDAVTFRNVLEVTSQGFFLVVLGLNLDLILGLCTRVPVLLPRKGLVIGSFLISDFYFLTC